LPTGYQEMIESISIANEASFAAEPETLTGLSQFNFLFGSNGTGKTTISRAIENESKYPGCSVIWKGGRKLQPMVYNHDFVERNFHQPAELKGVFTLGEEQKDVLVKIAAAKAEIDSLDAKIARFSVELNGTDGKDGKKGELAALENRLTETCWAQKQKHDAKLWGGFEGYRNSAEKFKNKVLQEQEKNTADLLSLAVLEQRAETVFGSTLAPEGSITEFDASNLLAHASNPILRKRVIGKNDVDIAAMITKLGNSDWVRAGRAYYDVNEGVCPFCQQSTVKALAKSLDEYFDETFVTDTDAINSLIRNYATDATRAQQQLANIISTPSRFLDIERFEGAKELLAGKFATNNLHLANKQNTVSQLVELESISDIITDVERLIDTANTKVAAHNEVVKNIASERTTLTAQVWKFVLDELKSDLAEYRSTKNGLEKAIAAITQTIALTTSEKLGKEAEVRALEVQTTSIQPTIDNINGLLSSFGFRGFKLAKTDRAMSYKLVRSDGSDAKATLSEGEKTFVSFLYFYHLLKGSASESGMTTARIVVFDDPVSSLDSDILFIVSSLIKGIFDEVRAGIGHIEQVFVFTHNVYFHKEVAFIPRRKKSKAAEATFGIIRKAGLSSKIQMYEFNPIKTSYELLWMEVRRRGQSNQGIRNALRRILENYFKILGGIDLDGLCTMFDGKEKIICNSLCSWVHDGSHYAMDDLYVAIDDSTIDVYLNVFRAIFYKSHHDEHYKMMMGDDFVDEPDGDDGLAAISPAEPAQCAAAEADLGCIADQS
jgi:wobble nucleotide-excising tRNase